MPDEIEARLDAARRFTSATRGADAAAKVTAGNLAQVERAIAAELPTLRAKAPASPPAPAAVVAPQPQADGRVSEEQYARMSHAERLDYCRGFRNP